EGQPGESIEIQLGFPAAVGASLLVSNILREKTRRFTVLGDSGSLTFDDMAADKLRLERNGQQEAIAIRPDAPLEIAVKEFADAIAASSRDDTSIELAVAGVEGLSACAPALASSQELPDRSTHDVPRPSQWRHGNPLDVERLALEIGVEVLPIAELLAFERGCQEVQQVITIDQGRKTFAMLDDDLGGAVIQRVHLQQARG